MKVIHAELQNSVNFPGSDILGYTTLNDSKTKGIQMEWDGKLGGLIVSTMKLSGGFIPGANVRNLKFEPNDSNKLHSIPKKA